MTYKSIIKAWNQTADEYNQWDSLGEDEKVEFAFLVGIFTHEVVPNRDVVAPKLQYVQESYDPDDGGQAIMDSVEKVISEMRQTCKAEGQSDTDMTRWADRLEALTREPIAWANFDRLDNEEFCCLRIEPIYETGWSPLYAAPPSRDIEAQSDGNDFLSHVQAELIRRGYDAPEWPSDRDDAGPVWSAAEMIGGLLERLRKAENERGKLYHAVNKMMAAIGADGEIRIDHPAVDAVMNALYDIDGGASE